MSVRDNAMRVVAAVEDGAANASTIVEQQTLRCCVEKALRSYFDHLEGHDAADLYAMVMTEVEMPLLKVVLEHTQENQSRAAEMLGMNRGTLRKKLKQYNML